MYISKLVIQNYRTFSDFSIELKPLTMIIGENNIGKSNLLDSIGLIFGQDISYFKRRILEIDDFNYESIVSYKKQVLDFEWPADKIIFPEIIIEVKLKDWDMDQEAVIADWFSNEDFTEACLKYVYAPTTKFNRLEEIKLQREFIAKYRNDISEEKFKQLPESTKLDLINFPITNYHYNIYGGLNNATTVNTYHLNQLKFELLDALRDACTELVASHNNKLLFRILNAKDEKEYQDLKLHLVELQKAIDENNSLNEIKKGVSAQLDKISLAEDDTTNLVGLIFSLPEVTDLLKKISLIYGDDPIKIERNGTGRNNLLFISLVLSHIEDITRAQSSYFRVVGLEEPESHLHPNLQDHLAHNIESLIRAENSSEYRKDIQLLITSHSTHITTKIDFDHTVVLYRKGKKILSHYVFSGFDNNALGKKQIKYLNKYLDAVNANLFYSSRIILVEGISEKLLIPIFFKMVAKHTTEKLGCCIINVNGLAFRYFLEIIRNGYFQRCLVFTDRDARTQIENRAEALVKEYGDVEQIAIKITKESTFEKDIIGCNKTGMGKDILLEVVEDIRPLSGKAYKKALGDNQISIDEYFSLIENYKSEFAYSLLIRLTKNDKGFEVPEYIIDGIKYLV